jgi:hypothetical protein
VSRKTVLICAGGKPGDRRDVSRFSDGKLGRVTQTMVFIFTPEGGPSKLRLGGGFPRLNGYLRLGKCQAAPDGAPSTAIRFPQRSSHRSGGDGNCSTDAQVQDFCACAETAGPSTPVGMTICNGVQMQRSPRQARGRLFVGRCSLCENVRFLRMTA